MMRPGLRLLVLACFAAGTLAACGGGDDGNNGNENCAQGYKSVDGKCVRECAAGYVASGDTCVKVCPAGTTAQGDTCVKTCATGYAPQGDTCVKVCGAGYVAVGDTCVIQCDPGFEPQGNTCVPASAKLPFAVDDFFGPSGYMGDGAKGAIVDSLTCAQRAGEGAGKCHSFTWTPGADGWAGVYWQYPDNNWGTQDGRVVAAGATRVSFWAWGETGKEKVKFLVGIADADGFHVETSDVTLSKTPTHYTISLVGKTYTDITGAFGWTSGTHANAPVVIHLDDIRWMAVENEVPGCTDSAADNFNAAATVNDWTCKYTVPTCTDTDAAGTSQDGACLYNVTFKVDMSKAALKAGDVVNVNGSFNGWCGACNAMTDANGDKVYEVTVPLAPGDYFYKFTINGWTTAETVPAECDEDPNPDFANRAFTVVDAPVVLNTKPFSSCPGSSTVAGCTDSDATNYNASATSDDGSCLYAVTFKVNMTGVTLAAGDVVNVNGEFNGWCGACNALTDANGDKIWELTLPLKAGSYFFKYTVNGWGAQETVPASCDQDPNPDFANRKLTVANAPTTLPVIPYNGCP